MLLFLFFIYEVFCFSLDCLHFYDLVARNLQEYIQPTRNPAIAAAASPPPAAAAAASTASAVVGGLHDSLGELSSCWLRLLRTGQHADLQLICREEIGLACHRLVVGLRCPLLLSQAVTERPSTGSTTSRDYIVMSDYDSCVVRVMLEYLYGGVFNLAALSERRQLAQLSRLARSFHLGELTACISSLEITEVEEEEEEDAGSGNGNQSRGFFDHSTNVDNTEEEEEDKKLECENGTQNLAALVSLLDDESADELGTGQMEEKDDWDELCVALTQKARERIPSSAKSSDDEEETGEETAAPSSIILQSEQRKEEDCFQMDEHSGAGNGNDQLADSFSHDRQGPASYS